MPSRRPPVAPPHGFTLIELLVVMVIAAIAVAAALPDMRRMMNENRVANEANSMLAVLAYARAEALRRNRLVGVCVSTDGVSCAAPGARGYAAGVIVFESNSGATPSALTRNASADTLIRVTVPVANGATILGGAGATNGVIFNPGGDLQLSATNFLYVVPAVGVTANSCQRLIELLPIGRARVIPARFIAGGVNSSASYTFTQDCGVAG